MLIKVLVVDDEPLARNRLQRLLHKIEGIEVVACVTNGDEAITAMDAQLPHLIFMDVEMPGMSGLTASEVIMKNYADDPPVLIFCTAYDNFALEAFKVNASDYLVKPVSFADLEQAVKRACQLSKLTKINTEIKKDYVLVKTAGCLEKISINDVNYFRSESKNVFAGLIGGQEIFIDLTLKELESEYFSYMVRVHRNSLVSKEKLKRLTRQAGRDQVEIEGCDLSFPVSRRMLNDVKKCFTQY